jgi:hypothetical protein
VSTKVDEERPVFQEKFPGFPTIYTRKRGRDSFSNLPSTNNLIGDYSVYIYIVIIQHIGDYNHRIGECR